MSAANMNVNVQTILWKTKSNKTYKHKTKGFYQISIIMGLSTPGTCISIVFSS